MIIERRLLPEVLPDNDEAYFSLLEGVIESLDPYASMSITRTRNTYHFRIVPSTTRDMDLLIAEITHLNRLIGIHLDMSKSMKSAATISFNIEFAG